jgi:hypothetical protein
MTILSSGGIRGYLMAKIRLGNWQIDKNIITAISIALILIIALIIVTAIDFWGIYRIENLDLIIFIGLMMILVVGTGVMVSLLSP